MKPTPSLAEADARSTPIAFDAGAWITAAIAMVMLIVLGEASRSTLLAVFPAALIASGISRLRSVQGLFAHRLYGRLMTALLLALFLGLIVVYS